MNIFLFIFFIITNNLIVSGEDTFGVNNQLELMSDMSTTCVNDLRTNLYLTFGMGVSDATVIIVSDNDLYLNCDLTFYTVGSSNSVFLIVVIEFPDHTAGPKNACQDPNSNIYIKELSLLREINVCDEVNKLKFGYFTTPVYSIITGANNVSIRVQSKSLFETVKITATAARRLSQYERCDSTREVFCMISNFSVCISRELLCDENINCGAADLNDEDVRICDEGRYKRLWLVVLSGTIMIMIVVFFLIHLLRTCLPAVPDSFFIFNEDEDNKLILSTQFVAPPESLREPAPKKLQQQTSSFRFKSIPVTQPQLTNLASASKPSHKKTKIPIEKEIASLNSEENETELDTHIYKSDIVELTPTDTTSTYKTSKPEQNVGVKETYESKQLPKKPRFQSDIINIMDYISLPSFSESEMTPSTEQRETKTKEADEQRRIQTMQQVPAKKDKREKQDETQKHTKSLN